MKSLILNSLPLALRKCEPDHSLPCLSTQQALGDGAGDGGLRQRLWPLGSSSGKIRRTNNSAITDVKRAWEGGKPRVKWYGERSLVKLSGPGRLPGGRGICLRLEGLTLKDFFNLIIERGARLSEVPDKRKSS